MTLFNVADAVQTVASLRTPPLSGTVTAVHGRIVKVSWEDSTETTQHDSRIELSAPTP